MRSSLLPREPVAYGQFAVPVATGLILGHARPAAAFWTAAAIAAFVAHEPLRIALGRRGVHALHVRGGRARRWSLMAGALAGLFAAAGFIAAPGIAVLAGVLVVACAAVVFEVESRRPERARLPGVLMAITSAAMLAPIALAGGAEPSRTLVAFAIFAAGFALLTASRRATD